jgi:hypothetical protein
MQVAVAAQELHKVQHPVQVVMVAVKLAEIALHPYQPQLLTWVVGVVAQETMLELPLGAQVVQVLSFFQFQQQNTQAQPQDRQQSQQAVQIQF